MMRKSAPRLCVYIILPSLIVTAAVLWSISSRQSTVQAPLETADSSMTSPYSRFSYVSGYFKHDLQPTGPEQGFRAETLPSLGIIDHAYDTDEDLKSRSTQWQRFESLIRHLNHASVDDSRYKVFFATRHGESVHNVKEREVGRHDWERYWARLDGDNEKTWLDAHLTDRGIQQAKILREFWENAIYTAKVPFPDKYYTSPLTRCLETTQLMFSDIKRPEGKRFQPVVKESLREIFGIHTCDKRSSRSWIKSKFPDYAIESGFTEADELWTSERRETLQERTPLWTGFLSEVFEDEDTTFVCITTHSGAIRALYLAIGHPDVWVASGAVVPVVVRGERTPKGNHDGR